MHPSTKMCFYALFLLTAFSSLLLSSCSHITSRPFSELPSLKRVLIDEHLGLFALSEDDRLVHIDYEAEVWKDLGRVSVPTDATVSGFGLSVGESGPYIVHIVVYRNPWDEAVEEIEIERKVIGAVHPDSIPPHKSNDLEGESILYGSVHLKLIESDSILVINEFDSIRTDLRDEDMQEGRSGGRVYPDVFTTSPFGMIFFARTLLLSSYTQPECRIILSTDDRIIGAKVFRDRLYVLSHGGKLKTFRVESILDRLDCE